MAALPSFMREEYVTHWDHSEFELCAQAHLVCLQVDTKKLDLVITVFDLLSSVCIPYIASFTEI